MELPFKGAANIFLLPFLLASWIHGEFFVDQADHVLDRLRTFIPEEVKKGEIIFVRPTHLLFFFHHFHPHISHPYILITHQFPTSVPDRFQSYLNDPKLLSWYGINVITHHPKLHPIPLGVPSPRLLPEKREASSHRPILLYLNFSDETHESRKLLRKQFEGADYCFVSESKKYDEYLADLAQSKFVLSPRGLGIDCYRTWEALIQGAIPIVLTSPLDPLFANLPVLIIESWKEISSPFLEETYNAMRTKEYSLEKLEEEYWFKKIKGLE